MARAMNVEKRISTLRSIVKKTSSNGDRALNIAAELTASFKANKSKEGKTALKLAAAAKKIAATLKKAAKTVSV